MFIPDFLYHTIYLVIMGLIALILGLKYQAIPTIAIIRRKDDQREFIYALVLAIFFILYFGLRNPYSEYFFDTIGYTKRFNAIALQGEDSPWFQIQNDSSERIWGKLLIYMATSGFSVMTWFTVIASVYILGILYSVKSLFPNNTFIALTFAFLNFEFYSGGVNGIRNSMALSLVLVILALICKHRKKVALPIVIGLIAIQIHNSCLLPILCLFASRYLIKKPKYAMYIWITCIFLSLAMGNYITNLFQGLGIDNRLDKYIEEGLNNTENSGLKTGFRWDFLLFSTAPILWGLYVMTKAKINDWKYNMIFNTYVLANSFWILVIRASFSNRFAALSWFLYFLVICYPLLKHDIFMRQGQVIAGALMFLLLIAVIL